MLCTIDIKTADVNEEKDFDKFPITEETTEKTTEKTTGKTTEKILAIIRSNPQVTYKELADALGLTEDGVYWSVKQLRTKGILRRIGGRKEGHWEVVE